MILRLVAGVGFLVLAGVIVFIGGIGRSLGGWALVLVLLVLGVALIVTVYLQPNLATKLTQSMAKQRLRRICGYRVYATINSQTKP